MNNKVNILGAGGHAKVMIEIAELLYIEIDKVFDRNPSIQNILDYDVVNDLENIYLSDNLFLALGNNKARQDNARSYSTSQYVNLIHPSAVLSKRISLGVGNAIMAGVIINSSSSVGNHCIINTTASIDHDCIIEDYAHISPKVGLADGVHIGEGSHIGVGATVRQQIKIDKWCTIGAGAVVINDVEDYSVVVGNPAKQIKRNDE